MKKMAPIAAIAALLVSMTGGAAVATTPAQGTPVTYAASSQGNPNNVSFEVIPSTESTNGWYTSADTVISVTAKSVQEVPSDAPQSTYQIFVNDKIFTYENEENFNFNFPNSISLKEGDTSIKMSATYYEKVEQEVEVEEPEESQSGEGPQSGEEGEKPPTIVVTWEPRTVVSETYNFKMDTQTPSISEINIDGDFKTLDGIGYVGGNQKIDVSVSANTGPSGIAKCDLFSEGNLIDSSSDCALQISESGSDYGVSVTSHSGAVSSIVSLIDLVPGFPNQMIFVNGAPGVNISTAGSTTFEKNDTTWHDRVPTVTANVTGEHLDTSTATVNSEPVEMTILSGEGTSSEVYSLDIPQELTSYNIVVEATNRAGKSTSGDLSFKTDNTPPTIEGFSVTGVFHNQDGKTYVGKDGISITAMPKDSESGVKEIQLLQNDKPFVEGPGGESKFTVTQSGDYSFKVIDNVGNVSIVSLEEFSGGQLTNTIEVKTEAPTVSISVPEANYEGDGKSWFAKAPSVTVKSSDILLEKMVVTVNEKPVTPSEGGVVDLSSATVNEDGSIHIKVVANDYVGNTAETSETVYVDSTKPKIERFVFTAVNGEYSGKGNESGKYGIFLKDVTTGFVEVSDAAPSSGIKNIKYRFISGDSGAVVSEKESKVVGNTAEIVVPSNFQGYLVATVQDNVNNVSGEESPSGLVTGPNNFHFNNANINIALPGTSFSDAEGLPLYNNAGEHAKVSISKSRLGIKSISWGIGSFGENQMGSVSSDGDGNLTGGVFSTDSRSKNLINAATGSLALTGEGNGLSLWVRTVDNADYVSETIKQFSIDTIAPQLSVVFSQTNDTPYYNVTRVAELTIKDTNFTPSGVAITGETGAVGNWSQVDSGVWENSITFSEDGDYQFTVSVKDLADNVGEGYSSEKFTIDKTSPTIAVIWNNNEPSEGEFYSEARVANVTVVETNFDPALVNTTGNGSITGWVNNGANHVSGIMFDKEGPSSFSINVTDRAGNTSDTYDSGNFYIHTEIPKVIIQGVSSGTAYHRAVGADIIIEDKFLLKPDVSLTNKKGDAEPMITSTFSPGKAFYHMDELPKDIKYDDLYNLNIKAENKAGTEVVDDVSFIVNRFGSQYSFMNEDYLGKYKQVPEDITINEYSVEPLNLEKTNLEVVKNTGAVNVQKGQTVSEEMTDTNYAHTFKKEIFSEDGVYNLSVFSSNKEDTLDSSSVSQEFSFVLDSTPPTVLISGVKDGGSYNTSAQEGTVEIRDSYGLDHTKVMVDDEIVEVNPEDGLYHFTIPEGDDHVISVAAMDMAGNVNEIVYDNITVTPSTLKFAWSTPLGKTAAVLGGTTILALGGLGIRKMAMASAANRRMAANRSRAISESQQQ